MNAPLHTYRASVHATATDLLAAFQATGSVTLSGEAGEAFLRKAIRISSGKSLPPPPREPAINRAEVMPALTVLVRRGRIASAGDLGRALKPNLAAGPANKLGQTRLAQLVRLGWAEHSAEEGWRPLKAGLDACPQIGRAGPRPASPEARP